MPVLKLFVRLSSFLGKEIAEVRRQLRLVLTLVLGPFLILFIFGVGYVNSPTKLSTILVVSPDSMNQAQEIKKQFAIEQLDVREVTADLNHAISELRARHVDSVVGLPADPYSDLLAGHQAIITINVNEIDPVKINIVYYLTYAYSNELNKKILESGFKQGQVGVGTLQEQVAAMRAAIGRLQQALASNDAQAISDESGNLLLNSNAALFAFSIAASTVDNSNIALASSGPATGQVNSIKQAQAAVQRLNANVQAIQRDAAGGQINRQQESQRLQEMQTDLGTIEAATGQIAGLQASVLVSPFLPYVKNLADKKDNPAGINPNFINYYTPSVLALLLQHIAVTLAALSLVRERTLGSLELFRVAPIRAIEILISKYISYILFIAVIAVVLVAALISPLLNVPFKGDVLWFSLTALALIFASLGLGFLISTVSQTESQAVQISMLVLLTSVFFSGFFLPLSNFSAPVQIGAYGLPITHGIAGFQETMLRGQLPTDYTLGSLVTMGIILFIAAWLLFRREMARG